MLVEKFVKEVLISELTDKTWGFTVYIPKDYPEKTNVIFEATGQVDLDLAGRDAWIFKEFTLSWIGDSKCVDNQGRVYVFDGVASIDELRDAIEVALRRAPIPTTMLENDYEIEIDFSMCDYHYYHPNLPKW